ncbi:MAG: sigma-70 family RNA polymerase sigma factor [Acidobacteriota bacterium]
MIRRRAGNRREEFEEVALPHADALYNFALKMTRNEKDAQDLVQDTYLRAFRFFHHFAAGTNCRAWLFRILKNVHINGYRKNQRSPDMVQWDQVEEFYDSVAPDDLLRRHKNPEEQVIDSSVDHRIETAIAELPAEYRAVVVLNFSEDLSYREIAEVLEIPIGTVMSRLHRARKTLQSKLREVAASRGIRPVTRRRPARSVSGSVVKMDRFRREQTA